MNNRIVFILFDFIILLLSEVKQKSYYMRISQMARIQFESGDRGTHSTFFNLTVFGVASCLEEKGVKPGIMAKLY